MRWRRPRAWRRRARAALPHVFHRRGPTGDCAGAGAGVRRRRQHCRQRWPDSRLHCCPEWPHRDGAGAGAGVRRRTHCAASCCLRRLLPLRRPPLVSGACGCCCCQRALPHQVQHDACCPRLPPRRPPRRPHGLHGCFLQCFRLRLLLLPPATGKGACSVAHGGLPETCIFRPFTAEK